MVLSVGMTWWPLHEACPVSSAGQLTYLPALHGRCSEARSWLEPCSRLLLGSQNTAPAILLLEFCAFLIRVLCWVLLLLEHCLSLEKALVLCSSLLPTSVLVPVGQRQTCYFHYADGNSEPHGGEVALQIPKVNTLGIPCDLVTSPPVQ